MVARTSRRNPRGLRLVLPGQPTRVLTTLVLDFNGTLAIDGVLIRGVRERLRRLATTLEIIVLTADTFGSARAAASRLPVSVEIVRTGADKRARVLRAGRARVIAIGNGRNDVAMAKVAGLAIAVLGAEGAASALILSADIVIRDITDALDLLLEPARLTATLRA